MTIDHASLFSEISLNIITFHHLIAKHALPIKKEYATKEEIGEAPARIRNICLDLIDHYTKRIEPNGYKAMLVATSREAAVTYK